MHTTRPYFRSLLAVVAALPLAACAHKAPPPARPEAVAPASLFAGPPDLEPKAIGILKTMSARLAAAKTMTFTAVATYESPSRFGPELAYTTTSDVTLQRPNKLRVVTPADGPAQQFVYDGKTMMAYAPGEDLVATAPAPATIDEALAAAYREADIYFPFTDVVVADPYQDISDGLKLAFYVGQSQVVGGVTTDMVVIANERVWAEIWVGAKDQLPRRVRAIYLDDPSRLRHEATLSNWKLNVPVAAGAFMTSAPKSAKRIAFARPEPQPPAGAGPTAKDAPAALKK